MRFFVCSIISSLILSGCNPRQAYFERRSAEAIVDRADVIAVAEVGEEVASYEINGRVYTDIKIKVIRGKTVDPGDELIVRRAGGRLAIPGSDIARIEHSDTVFRWPESGEEAFFILRRIGDKYEVLDLMALHEGMPRDEPPSNAVFLREMNTLQ